MTNKIPESVTDFFGNDKIEQAIKEHSMTANNAAKSLLHDVKDAILTLERRKAELEAAIVAPRFNPALDEPSVFSFNGVPSTDWCLWHSHVYGVSIIAAFEVGVTLIQTLKNELPRSSNEIPSVANPWVLSQQFKKAGINKPCVSLMWVIGNKYELDITWEQAHSNAVEAIKDAQELR